jgi:hypothetical protein
LLVFTTIATDGVNVVLLPSVVTLLHEGAKKHSITIEPLTDEEWEKYKTEEKAGRDKAKKHPVIKYCEAYLLQAKALLDNNDLLQQKGAEIIQHAQLGIKNMDETKDEVEALGNCLEIVQ